MNDFENFIYQPQIIDRRVKHQITETEGLKSRSLRLKNNFTKQMYLDSKKKIPELMIEYESAYDSVVEWLYNNLKNEEAEILELRYLQDLSIKEISIQLHLSDGGARERIKRAMKKAEQIYNTNLGRSKNGKLNITL